MKPSFIKELNEEKMTVKDWIIELICYNRPISFFRKIGRFILRLIRWIPVLWRQEEWDFGYVYDILEHKLKELRSSVEEDTWHTQACVQEELRQIDSCLSHLVKYRNWEKYVELPKSNIERWIKNENGTYSMNFSEKELKACEKASEFEEEHYNAFWDELKKYNRNWWT